MMMVWPWTKRWNCAYSSGTSHGSPSPRPITRSVDIAPMTITTHSPGGGGERRSQIHTATSASGGPRASTNQPGRSFTIIVDVLGAWLARVRVERSEDSHDGHPNDE